MKFKLDNFNRNISDKELVLDLKHIAKNLGKTPTIDEYNRNGSYHAATIIRRFGTWLKACNEAGLEIGKRQKNARLSNEQLFQNLEEVWIKLGRQPRREEIQKPLSKYSAGPYESRFGAWRKALERFVEYVNSEEGVSSEESMKKIKSADFPAQHKTPRSINLRLRFIIMRRDNFKCVQCGRVPATDPKIVLHVDHIKAWTNGGETVLENLQTLCSKCNIGKSDL